MANVVGTMATEGISKVSASLNTLCNNLMEELMTVLTKTKGTIQDVSNHKVATTNG